MWNTGFVRAIELGRLTQESRHPSKVRCESGLQLLMVAWDLGTNAEEWVIMNLLEDNSPKVFCDLTSYKEQCRLLFWTTFFQGSFVKQRALEEKHSISFQGEKAKKFPCQVIKHNVSFREQERQVCQQPPHKINSFLSHPNHILWPALPWVIKSFTSGLGVLSLLPASIK